MLDFALPKGTASTRGNRLVGTVAAANEAKRTNNRNCSALLNVVCRRATCLLWQTRGMPNGVSDMSEYRAAAAK